MLNLYPTQKLIRSLKINSASIRHAKLSQGKLDPTVEKFWQGIKKHDQTHWTWFVCACIHAELQPRYTHD